MLKPSELLSQPGAWCQNALARTREGNRLLEPYQEAASWCAMGAIARTAVDESQRAKMIARLSAHLSGRWKSIADWNDEPVRTQTEVVQAFKEIGL